MFFVVPEDKINAFTAAVLSLKTVADYERLLDSFGVRRSIEDFWSIFATINSIHIANNRVQSGALDLTRYALDAKQSLHFIPEDR